MSSEQLHEATDQLSNETLEQHRALTSLMEELEAVDWYAQRIEASTDPALVAVLTHNRDEEKEHAAMLLEWLRRQDPVLDQHLRAHLFQEGRIASAPPSPNPERERGITIGGLKEVAS